MTKKAIFYLTFAAALIAGVTGSHAQTTRTWTGGAGNWTNAVKWGGTVPQTGENATIANGGLVTLDTASETVLRTTVGSGNATEDALIVDSGGTLTANELWLYPAANGSETSRVSVTGGTIDLTGSSAGTPLTIARKYTGVFTLQSGSVLTKGVLLTQYAGGRGYVAIEGGNFECTGFTAGALEQQNLITDIHVSDGTMTVNGDMALGSGTNQAHALRIDGGTVEVTDDIFMTGPSGTSDARQGPIHYTFAMNGGRLEVGDNWILADQETSTGNTQKKRITSSNTVNSGSIVVGGDLWYGGQDPCRHIIEQNGGVVEVRGSLKLGSNSGSNSTNLYTLNGGVLWVHGTFSSRNPWSPDSRPVLNGGTLAFGLCDYTVGALANHGAELSPGYTNISYMYANHSNNAYTETDASCAMHFQLAGTNHTDGVEYDRLRINATMSIQGELRVSFKDGFEDTITADDVFYVVRTGNGALSGTFANAPQTGDRIVTVDGNGSFQVDYLTGHTLAGFWTSQDVVRLSAYLPPPQGTVLKIR